MDGGNRHRVAVYPRLERQGGVPLCGPWAQRDQHGRVLISAQLKQFDEHVQRARQHCALRFQLPILLKSAVTTIDSITRLWSPSPLSIALSPAEPPAALSAALPRATKRRRA